jgi:hypothetical protein
MTPQDVTTAPADGEQSLSPEEESALAEQAQQEAEYLQAIGAETVFLQTTDPLAVAIEATAAQANALLAQAAALATQVAALQTVYAQGIIGQNGYEEGEEESSTQA